MKLVNEFKEFALKGNMVDMSIGVLIGTAFGKIIDSFISDMLMPPVGLLLGKVDFASLYINLSGQPFDSLVEAKANGAATINYGLFISAVLHFLIVTFAIFISIKQINKLRTGPVVPLATKECPYCKSSISLEAVRCPRCTSHMPGAVNGNKTDRPRVMVAGRSRNEKRR